jgi:ATP-dependent protease ClpP protease subunit
VNKRRRAILDALTPAVQFAMEQPGGAPPRPLADVPGLSMRARVTAEAPGELLIYGRIMGSASMWMEGIAPSDVANALKELGAGPVNVRINSGGGDVFGGVAIHSLLARHPGIVTVYVDGVAASAASFIMLAGERVIASRNAMIMIHDAMTGVWGNREAFQRAMDLLDRVSDNIADMYAEKAGEDVEFWRAKMLENGEDGVWYTGMEALDAGLVDEVIAAKDDDDDVDALLRGWVNLLPREVAARVENAKTPDVDPAPAKTAVTPLDVTGLNDILKGVFA